MSRVEKHFVTFYSPGTFVAETTVKEIDSWDTDQAVKLADEITERHGATPYGFRFSTRMREENDLDSKEASRSNLYYLGGKIETLQDVEARNDPNERILLSNMRANGWGKIVVNYNSWKWTQPLEAEDVVLDYTPPKKREKTQGGMESGAACA